MIRRLLLALLLVAIPLAACSKSERAPAAPPPSEAVISAMRDYCKIGEMPRDKQREAQTLWGWTNGSHPEMGPLWHRAAANKERAAIATVRAAAVQAVGAGNCPILDALKE